MQYSDIGIREIAKEYQIPMVELNDRVVTHLSDTAVSAYIVYMEKSKILNEEKPEFNERPDNAMGAWAQAELLAHYAKSQQALHDEFWARFQLEKNEQYGLRFNGEKLVVVIVGQTSAVRVVNVNCG